VSASSAETRGVLMAASYPPRDYRSKADSHEIAAAVNALVGAVFQAGWVLVFGGHPTISPLVLMIAREYGQKNRVMIYQSTYFANHIGPATVALVREGFGEIVPVPHAEEEVPPPASEPINPTKCPRSLTAMRESMMRHPGIAGLVLVGGDTGLREELDLFEKIHQKRLPIIPIGAPGGIAKELVSEARLPGMEVPLLQALQKSKNYLTLCTNIVRYLSVRPSGGAALEVESG
jgi:SLOG cluster3 family